MTAPSGVFYYGGSMIFKGSGSIWNPEKNKVLVNFNKTPEFETEDPKEIEILIEYAQPQGDIPETIENESISLSKKEIIEILKERDIDFNPRDKKEVLESLMYQE